MSAGIWVGSMIMVAGAAWAFAIAWLMHKYEDASLARLAAAGSPKP